MTLTDSANAALDFLKEKGYRADTNDVVHFFATEHGWNPTYKNKVRSLLQLLADNNLVTRYGGAKKSWKIAVDTWDREKPVPMGNTKFGSTPRHKPVAPITTAAVGLTEQRVLEIIEDFVEKPEVDMAHIIQVAAKEVTDELVKRKVVKQELHIKINDVPAMKIEGVVHAAFPRAVRLATARRNVLLVGPAGCGKTYFAEQVAKSIGLRFAHISCSVGMSEGQVTGRQLPTGEAGQFEYTPSEFVRCYEEGGLFLFDEVDAADPNTMLVINSALANGKMALSNRPNDPVAKKHKDFVCFAAANTYGTGADRMYVGRNQLDESTLDRFRIGQIEMDYDNSVEEALCPDDELRVRLQEYRRRALNARLRRIISTRFLMDAYVMKNCGDTEEDIEKALFSGWSKDEIQKVKGYGY